MDPKELLRRQLEEKYPWLAQVAGAAGASAASKALGTDTAPSMRQSMVQGARDRVYRTAPWAKPRTAPANTPMQGPRLPTISEEAEADFIDRGGLRAPFIGPLSKGKDLTPVEEGILARANAEDAAYREQADRDGGLPYNPESSGGLKNIIRGDVSGKAFVGPAGGTSGEFVEDARRVATDVTPNDQPMRLSDWQRIQGDPVDANYEAEKESAVATAARGPDAAASTLRDLARRPSESTPKPQNEIDARRLTHEAEALEKEQRSRAAADANLAKAAEADRLSQRDKEKNFLRGMKGLSESLGGMDLRGLAHFMPGGPPAPGQPPVIAEDARQRLSEIQDDEEGAEFKKAIKETLGIEIDADVPASTLTKLLGPIVAQERNRATTALAMADAVADERQAEQDRIVENSKTINDLRKEMSQPTSFISGYRKARDEASRIRKLVETNSITLRAAAIGLVKAAGDTGRLSNQDIEMFSNRPGMAGIYDRFYRFIHSDGSPEYKEEVIAAAEALMKASQVSVRRQAESATEQFLAVPGHSDRFTIDDVLGALISKDELSAGEARPMVMVEIDGRKGRVPQDELPRVQAENPGATIRVLD